MKPVHLQKGFLSFILKHFRIFRKAAKNSTKNSHIFLIQRTHLVSLVAPIMSFSAKGSSQESCIIPSFVLPSSNWNITLVFPWLSGFLYLWGLQASHFVEYLSVWVCLVFPCGETWLCIWGTSITGVIHVFLTASYQVHIMYVCPLSEVILLMKVSIKIVQYKVITYFFFLWLIFCWALFWDYVTILPFSPTSLSVHWYFLSVLLLWCLLIF